jgi:hypothetical protein
MAFFPAKMRDVDAGQWITGFDEEIVTDAHVLHAPARFQHRQRTFQASEIIDGAGIAHAGDYQSFQNGFLDSGSGAGACA